MESCRSCLSNAFIKIAGALLWGEPLCAGNPALCSVLSYLFPRRKVLLSPPRQSFPWHPSPRAFQTPLSRVQGQSISPQGRQLFLGFKVPLPFSNGPESKSGWTLDAGRCEFEFLLPQLCSRGGVCLYVCPSAPVPLLLETGFLLPKG